MDYVRLLSDCGLSEKQSRTYLALLEIGPATVTPIARHTGLKRTSIYNFIDELVELGIVGRTTRRGRRYFHPEPIENLLRLQRSRCARLEELIPKLKLQYHRLSRESQVRFYKGAAEIRNIMREEVACRKEALYIWPMTAVVPTTGGTKYLAALDRERVKKGIKVRSIRFRNKSMKFETSGIGRTHLREVRFAPHGLDINVGAAIFDTQKVAFFSSPKENFGILIESEDLSNLMRTLFHCFWAQCDPASAGEE